MPVTIDQVEIETPTAPPAKPQTSATAPPDARELERLLHVRRERVARVRAH
jgi:hypothetical protein